MFGNTITLAETGLITIIGMGTVFFVLILLVVLLTLFRFIPSPVIENTHSQTLVPTQTLEVSDTVLSLHKAIIIAAILESQGSDMQKHKVRISRIRKIL